MEQTSQLTEFGKILIFLIIGILLVSATLLLSKLLAPNKPNALKLSSYECGEEPTGNSWIQFNTRFYVIALIFLLFDVEMVFIFPWTTIFAQKTLIEAAPDWGWFTLVEMFIFVGILIIGLVYVWKRGDLDWIKPEQKLPTVDVAIPKSAYDRINNEVYTVKEFSLESVKANVEDNTAAVASPASKPGFKSTFRKG